jgi:hypothetical protein
MRPQVVTSIGLHERQLTLLFPHSRLSTPSNEHAATAPYE